MESKNPRLDQVRPHNVSQFCTKLSHLPSVEQKFECHHVVWLEEAFHEQTQAKRGSVKRRQLVHEHKWTDPESQLKMSQAQDSFSKNLKRKSMSEDKSKSSLVPVRQHRLLQSSECSVAFKSNEHGST